MPVTFKDSWPDDAHTLLHVGVRHAMCLDGPYKETRPFTIHETAMTARGHCLQAPSGSQGAPAMQSSWSALPTATNSPRLRMQAPPRHPSRGLQRAAGQDGAEGGDEDVALDVPHQHHWYAISCLFPNPSRYLLSVCGRSDLAHDPSELFCSPCLKRGMETSSSRPQEQ